MNDGTNYVDGVVRGNEIILSSKVDGIIYSSDAGETWDVRNTSLTGYWAPIDASIYTFIYNNNYLVAYNTYYDDYSSGIIVSSDKGQTWKKSNFYFTGQNNYPISSFFAIDNILFAHSVRDAGLILRSSDNGFTWDTCAMPPTKIPGNRLKLFSSDKYLFASVDSLKYNTQWIPKGFFRSGDYGHTWEKISDLSFDFMISVGDTIMPVRYNAAWEFYISPDNGETWNYRQWMKDSLKIFDFKIDKNKLYVLYEKGILQSTDFGYTWSNFARYQKNYFASIKDINIMYGCCYKLQFKNENVYIVGDSALYVSKDLGQNWERKTWGMNTRSLRKLEVWEDNFYIFGGNSGNNKIFKSTDFGKTWNKLEIYDNNQFNIYDCVEYNGNTLISTSNGVLYYNKSQNKFQPTSLLTTNQIKLRLLYSNNNLYASGPDYMGYFSDNVYGLYIASSNGLSWFRTKPDLQSEVEMIRASYPLQIDNKIFLVYIFYDWNYSFISGYSYTYEPVSKKWTLLDTSGIFIEARSRGVYKNNLLAGMDDGKVYKSSDGINWELFFESGKIPNIFFEYGDNLFFCSYYYGATASNVGIFHSNDDGMSLRNITYNLNDSSVAALRIYKDYLIANTNRRGLYYAKLSDLGITSVEEQNPEITNKGTIQVFPNPAVDNVEFIMPEDTVSGIFEIYNMQSQKVFTQSDAVGNIKLNTKVFSPGVYFCIFKSGIQVITTKFLVVR